jgi:hypothetical protein
MRAKTRVIAQLALPTTAEATDSAAGADVVHHRLHDDLSRFKRLIEDTGS